MSETRRIALFSALIFFGINSSAFECELLDRQRFKSQIEARMAIFDFIEGWYNPHRRHSALDYVSPMQNERINMAAG